MIIVILDLLVNLEAVGLERNLRFDTEVELFKFFRDRVAVILRGVIDNELLCGDEPEIVYEEFRDRKRVLRIRYDRELLVDDAVLEEQVGVSADEVVIIVLMLLNDRLDLLLRHARELADLAQELARLHRADREVLVMKVRSPELPLHLLHVPESDPW